MILKDNKKYACETCIRGHRASSCQHTNRPLVEVRKKGRPVTSCRHCQTLRTSLNIHPSTVCICHRTPMNMNKSMVNLNHMSNSASKNLTNKTRNSKLNMSSLDNCPCLSGGNCICHKKVKNTKRANNGENVSLMDDASTIVSGQSPLLVDNLELNGLTSLNNDIFTDFSLERGDKLDIKGVQMDENGIRRTFSDNNLSESLLNNIVQNEDIHIDMNEIDVLDNSLNFNLEYKENSENVTGITRKLHNFDFDELLHTDNSIYDKGMTIGNEKIVINDISVPVTSDKRSDFDAELRKIIDENLEHTNTFLQQ